MSGTEGNNIMENEKLVQYIIQNGERVAFFDEEGTLYVMKKATLVDRRQIFNTVDVPKI